MQLVPIKPSMLTITNDILGFLHAYVLGIRVALNFLSLIFLVSEASYKALYETSFAEVSRKTHTCPEPTGIETILEF